MRKLLFTIVNNVLRLTLPPPSPPTPPVVPRDGPSAGGNQSHHPGRELGPAVPGHPDGSQVGEGALRAGGGGVRQRREVGPWGKKVPAGGDESLAGSVHSAPQLF